MISVECPSCKRAHKAPETLIGKRVQCKDCGASFLITSTASDIPQDPDRPQNEHPKVEAEKPMPLSPEEPMEPDRVSPATGVKKPFGLAWIVFYWIIAGIGSIVESFMFFLAGAMGGALAEIFEEVGLEEAERAPRVVSVLLEFAGVLLFHYGLLILVTCYGLWTFRRWGVTMGRALAIVSLVLNTILFIICLVSRVGVVISVVSLLISLGILLYLYEHPLLSRGLRELSRVGRLGKGMWTDYK